MGHLPGTLGLRDASTVPVGSGTFCTFLPYASGRSYGRLAAGCGVRPTPLVSFDLVRGLLGGGKVTLTESPPLGEGWAVIVA
jgi:hypothetical protein